ncbi:hypothetical protein [Clostridium beijerinckii]|uniref:hypothetical protein n=1 Tax=Clostridium beijerinckii TaxID=1520 RepID=UPI001570A605|nr:hypothetical protein [Clostridium beijerinckii]NRT72215.1 hypothetical protein [Clostridium beijerinckii]
MGAIHGLRIKSPYKLLKIEDIRIENKPNEHGYLYLKCLIDDSINFDSAIKASTDDKISVYEELEDENNSAPNYGTAVDINEVNERNSSRLFDGIVNDIKTSNVNNIYYLEIEALTSSIELDIEEKSRSFQNLDMTYDELIENILNDYSGYNFSQYIGQGEKIGRPLFQYMETDWNFLKRLASELSSELYSDIINSNDLFYFGRPDNASYELEDTKYYKAHKNLHRFREAGGYDTGYDTDYFYYELETREKYNIGDEIYFKNKQLYVNQYSAYAIKDEVIYKYRLCRKNGVWQTKLYNSLLSGASLEGKVIDRQGEQVKLQLKIDNNQNNEEASWFRFAPPTGNMMYCMPVIGTDARLYFPNESSEAPIVTGCLRTNGGSCQKTSDTTKRYLGTEHGSEIEMVPDAINIKGGSSSPLSIKFEDSIGVTLTSPKKLMMSASEEIIMKTPKSVKINAQSQIAIVKTNSGSGLAIEGDLNYKSNNVILDGTFKEPFPDFDDDEPKLGKKPDPPKEEKSGFNWGLLAKCALVAVAVVASVATFGVGATLLIGAVMAATAVVGAINSTAGNYLYAGLEVVGGVITVAAAVGAVIFSDGLSSPMSYVAAVHGLNSIADGIRDFKHLANGENNKVGTENYLRDGVYKPVGKEAGGYVGSAVDGTTKLLTGKETNYSDTFSKGGEEIGNLSYYGLDMYSGWKTVGESSKVLKDVPKIKTTTIKYEVESDGGCKDMYVQIKTDGAPFVKKAYATINGYINSNALYYDSNDLNGMYLK